MGQKWPQNCHFLQASYERHSEPNETPYRLRHSLPYGRFTQLPIFDVRPLVPKPYARFVKGFCFIVIIIVTLVYLIEVTTRGHGIFLIMFVSLFIWYKKICHVYLVCLAPYFDRKWNAAMLIEVVSHFILYKKVCLDY